MVELTGDHIAQKEILKLSLKAGGKLLHIEVQRCRKNCKEIVDKSVSISNFNYRKW